MEVKVDSGWAKAEAGDWLTGRAQPAAYTGKVTVKTLRGFIVPDRALVRSVTSDGVMYCSSSDAPFLTRLDALPDEPLHLVSAKLLIAPLSARSGAKAVKLIPFSFQRSTPVTEFRGGWAMAATKSRVTRVALEEGGTLTVRPESVVAWIGNAPSGFCPKLSVLDVILPRAPKNLAYTFHGPATIWFEGGCPPPDRRQRARMIIA